MSKCIPLIILIFLILNSSQYIRDSSFIRFCDNIKGKKILINDKKSAESDKCEVLWKQFPASSEEEARTYCKNWGPFPLVEAKVVNGRTWCKYENGYECHKNYIQINGYCYLKISIKNNKKISYKAARNMCQKKKITTFNGVVIKADLVYLYDIDLIRLLDAFFTELKMFFVQPADHLNEFVDFNDGGPNYAVVMSMAIHYQVGPRSIIKPSKTTKVPQVICVYKPEENPASFEIKAKLLKPYYYPTQHSNLMTVWRTSSHYSFMNHPSFSDAVQKCKSSMSALFGVDSGDIMDIKTENVARLSDEVKQSVVLSYAPYFHCCQRATNGRTYFYVSYLKYQPRNFKDIKECIDLPDIDERHKISQNGGKCPIDPKRNLVSFQTIHSFLFTPKQIDSLDIIERNVAQNAPIFCSIFYRIHKKPTKCSPTWNEIHRESGAVVCTIHFETQYAADDAASFCHHNLITFSSEEEYQTLKSLGRRIWIGLKKRDGCSYRVDDGSYERCNKYNIGVWSNKFGEDTEKIRLLVESKWHTTNPDISTEYCIILDPDTGLHDWPCGDTSIYTSCIDEYKVFET